MTLERVSTSILSSILSTPTEGLSTTPIAFTTTTLMTPTARPTVAPLRVMARVAEYGPLMSLLFELIGSSAALAIMAEDGDKDYKVDSVDNNDDIDA